MTLPTDSWLNAVNERLRADDVAPSLRPELAWRQLAMESGVAMMSSHPAVKRIFDWFSRNTQAKSRDLAPLFRGVYYFDASFWSLTIPQFFGTCRLCPEDALTDMPQSMLRDLMSSPTTSEDFVDAWADSVDYALSFDSLQRVEQEPDTAGFLQGADRELRGAATLLLNRTPGADGSQSSRFAVEMAAKWFLRTFSTVSTEALRVTYGHDVEKLLGECARYLPSGALDSVLPAVARLPAVSVRYSAVRPEPSALWDHYRTALRVSAMLLRAKTGQNCRG